MPSIFLSQFANSMMYSIYKKFCFISINFTLKMLPEKRKLEVSIKSRSNSNLQAFLCGRHQMRPLQARLDQSTLKCLSSCKTSLSASNVQNVTKLFHLYSNICMNISLIVIIAVKWLIIFFYKRTKMAACLIIFHHAFFFCQKGVILIFSSPWQIS